MFKKFLIFMAIFNICLASEEAKQLESSDSNYFAVYSLVKNATKEKILLELEKFNGEKRKFVLCKKVGMPIRKNQYKYMQIFIYDDANGQGGAISDKTLVQDEPYIVIE